MKLTKVTVTGVAISDFAPVDYEQISPQLGISVIIQGTATFSVQHTFSDIFKLHSTGGAQDGSAGQSSALLTRAAAVATVTIANHGLAVGDYIKSTGNGAPFDNGPGGAGVVYAVATVPTVNTFTFAVANSGATVGYGGFIQIANVLNHSTMAAVSANSSGSYAFPIAAVRLNVTASTGTVTMIAIMTGVR